jgi:SpoIID/LytB domain protein
VVANGVTGGVRFLTSAKPAVSRVTVVSTSGNNRTYRGFLDVRRSTTGLLPVSTLLLEHYLRSVVAAEVPSSWTKTALRAQAVAARSYALLAQVDARSERRRYDICDNSNCQAYGPVRFEAKAESAAVKATEGLYLASKGKPAFTQFSSANGGYSVAGSRGYLVAQRDPYDGIVTGAANWGHSWDVTVSARTISNAWPTIGKLKAIKVLSRDGNGRWDGRVRSLALVGSRGTVSISGDSFRWGLGLKSTWWTIKNA